MTAQVHPGSAASARQSAPPLVAAGVVRRYGNGRGVGPVDLELAAGETVALMGPNGCGKTTLLRVLATVARPQRGTVRWFGGSAADGRRQLGLALDSAIEEGGLSGRQATAFWCAQWLDSRIEVATRTGSILDRLDLVAAADDPVSSYSFGMRRRLALAAALVHDPGLAVLDEPTAGLDPDGACRLRELLAGRRVAGLSTLVASNDAAFVEDSADRVLFLDDGLPLRCAAPAELMAALPAGRIAELEVDGPPPAAELAALEGVDGVTVAEGVLTVHFSGERTVAALVATADAPGGRLRQLRLRRPDLSDCFRSLTGRTLERHR